jgi:hypothetical protein
MSPRATRRLKVCTVGAALGLIAAGCGGGAYEPTRTLDLSDQV